MKTTRVAFSLALLLSIFSSTACDDTGDCGPGVFVLIQDLSAEEFAEEDAKGVSCEDTCEAAFRRESPTDPVFVTPQECALTPSDGSGARLECTGQTQRYECD